jgi:hypothetical protein
MGIESSPAKGQPHRQQVQTAARAVPDHRSRLGRASACALLTAALTRLRADRAQRCPAVKQRASRPVTCGKPNLRLKIMGHVHETCAWVGPSLDRGDRLASRP